jgi:hypothetical protein
METNVRYRIVIIDTAFVEIEGEKKIIRYPYGYPVLFPIARHAISVMREFMTSSGATLTELAGKYPSAVWLVTAYRDGKEVANAGIHKVIAHGDFVEYRSHHLVQDGGKIVIYPADRSRVTGLASNLDEALMVVDSFICMAYL